MIRFLLFIILLLGVAPPPSLSPHETFTKAEEIFKAHARYKTFTTELAARTLTSFLEELDPAKCYLTQEAIGPFLNPSEETLERVVADYKRQKFTAFQTLYATFLAAIPNRATLEAEVASLPLPEGVSSKELHEAAWPANRGELKARLLKIKALQQHALTQMPSEEQGALFLQRIQKRRSLHEKEFLGASSIDQTRQTLTLFLKSLASSLDSHTMYFTPQEAKQFLIQVQQRLFGIGAMLRDDLDGFTVVQIVEGGPASNAKELKVGDKIIAVNHESIAGMDITEAVERIRGPRGSSAILTILRDTASAERFDIVIVREEIVLTERRFSARTEPYGGGAIGYLALHSFYQDPRHSSYSDLKQALDEMKRSHNLHGLILDLRNNSGGLLPQAVDVTGLFIDRGVVVSIKDHTGAIQRFRNLNEEISWEGPLIVLINRTSASASEIVALALSDYGRALIVGDETSYGKGSYQVFTLGDNPDRINPQGEYKVTRGAYYTVAGNTPQLVGVRSNIEVPGLFNFAEIGERYTKYPLVNDTISPYFEDDLSDVHPLYRNRLKKLLHNHTQQKSTALQSLIPILKTHSEVRIQSNPNYQHFLSEVKAQEEINPNLVGQNDLQLEEAFNIMKELVVLTNSH